MKKRFFVLFFGIILMFSLVSAQYACSEGSELTIDQDEIDLGERKIVSGLAVGLIYAEETIAFNREEIELAIEAKKFELSNETPSEVISLGDFDYDFELVDVFSDNATIKVEGSSKSIELGESEIVSTLVVYLHSVQGTYPGQGSAEGIAGLESLVLTNENPFEIKTLEGVDYLLELTTASDNDAIIKVSKCKDETQEIIEEAISVNETTQNQTSNETVVDSNVTEEGNETEETASQNTTEIDSNATNVSSDNGQISGSESEEGSIPWMIILVFIVLIIAIVITFLVFFKMKSRPNSM